MMTQDELKEWLFREHKVASAIRFNSQYDGTEGELEAFKRGCLLTIERAFYETFGYYMVKTDAQILKERYPDAEPTEVDAANQAALISAATKLQQAP